MTLGEMARVNQEDGAAIDGYAAFLSHKRTMVKPSGFTVDPATLNPMLFDWQRDITAWALRRGKAALLEDCGLGKTAQQLEWAHQVSSHTGQPVLVLAPLAVAAQTRREGEKFGIPVTVCRTQSDVRPGVNVTNYEMLGHYTPDGFAGLVLDESSILRNPTGFTRNQLIAFAQTIPYRLACSATPAPNDLAEIVNHAEFLGVMNEREIKALYFTQDGNSTREWRLKGHARDAFWTWLRSWAVAARKPSDLGYPDGAFVLPELHTHEWIVLAEMPTDTLFPMTALTMDEQRKARRGSVAERVSACANLVNRSADPWLIWCDLNDESTALTRAIPDAVEVRGSDSPEHKERALLDFAEGRLRVLVSKPSICGHGMNFQHCAHMAFVGVSHSFERYYQAVRRCWRFGQEREVHVHVITSETEGAVLANVRRKHQEANTLMDNLIARATDMESLTKAGRDEMEYREGLARGRKWTLYLGDCVEQARRIETESVGLCLYSPPFPSMYSYTNSARDMGNVRDIEEMLAHYRFLIPELLRVTMPGRVCAVHLTQALAFKSVDGHSGLKDYRGAVIAAMEAAGWIYYREVTIDKNPQMKAQRTKDRSLLFKTLAEDSAWSGPALADYLIQFRKPGENPVPIRSGLSTKYDNPNGWITTEEWIEWAAPVWYRQTADYPGGIRETDTLNVTQARETDDERHLCPLQLGVIERAVKLWTAPGDLVFSPFAGIGSEGVRSLELGRRFVGTELKESYFRSAATNLRAAEQRAETPDLFAWADAQTEAVS